MTMSLVSTVTVGAGGAASIEFTGIPQTGQDLMVVLSARTSEASVRSTTYLQLNGDTASNYTMRVLYGTGSTVTSFSGASANIQIGSHNGASSTANTFSNFALYIPNYKAATAKSVSADSVTENNATEAWQWLTAGSWSGTAAITSLNLYSGVAFVQNSTASLYTISTTGATGATVA